MILTWYSFNSNVEWTKRRLSFDVFYLIDDLIDSCLKWSTWSWCCWDYWGGPQDWNVDVDDRISPPDDGSWLVCSDSDVCRAILEQGRRFAGSCRVGCCYHTAFYQNKSTFFIWWSQNFSMNRLFPRLLSRSCSSFKWFFAGKLTWNIYPRSNPMASLLQNIRTKEHEIFSMSWTAAGSDCRRGWCHIRYSARLANLA